MKRQFKISIQQPSIPLYRKSLFEKIGEKFSAEFFYGSTEIENVEISNSRSHFFPVKVLKVFSFYLKWHLAQLRAVDRRFDLAILSWDVQYITLWLSLLKSKLIGVPVVLWGHGFSKREHFFKKWIRDIPISFASSVIFYDFHTAKSYGFSKEKTSKFFVAPNSLDNEKIQIAIDSWGKYPNQLEDFKAKHKISNTANIIYVGRIYSQNNLEELIEALTILSKTIPQIRLIVVGNGNNYLDELKELAKRSGIEDNLVWTGAIYLETELAPWMLSSQIFCYPSNIGLSLIHAFNYSLPVITDDNLSHHNPEIWALKDKHNGLLYEKGNPRDLASKIEYLLKNKDLLNSLSRNSLHTVYQKFNTSEMVNAFEEAICHSLSKKLNGTTK